MGSPLLSSSLSSAVLLSTTMTTTTPVVFGSTSMHTITSTPAVVRRPHLSSAPLSSDSNDERPDCYSMSSQQSSEVTWRTEASPIARSSHVKKLVEHVVNQNDLPSSNHLTFSHFSDVKNEEESLMQRERRRRRTRGRRELIMGSIANLHKEEQKAKSEDNVISDDLGVKKVEDDHVGRNKDDVRFDDVSEDAHLNQCADMSQVFSKDDWGRLDDSFDLVISQMESDPINKNVVTKEQMSDEALPSADDSFDTFLSQMPLHNQEEKPCTSFSTKTNDKTTNNRMDDTKRHDEGSSKNFVKKNVKDTPSRWSRHKSSPTVLLNKQGRGSSQESGQLRHRSGSQVAFSANPSDINRRRLEAMERRDASEKRRLSSNNPTSSSNNEPNGSNDISSQRPTQHSILSTFNPKDSVEERKLQAKRRREMKLRSQSFQSKSDF